MSLDNFWALKYFIMHFPEYSKNEFFLTGESYGGIYVPTLAARIVDDKDFNFKVIVLVVTRFAKSVICIVTILLANILISKIYI